MENFPLGRSIGGPAINPMMSATKTRLMLGSRLVGVGIASTWSVCACEARFPYALVNSAEPCSELLPISLLMAEGGIKSPGPHARLGVQRGGVARAQCGGKMGVEALDDKGFSEGGPLISGSGGEGRRPESSRFGAGSAPGGRVAGRTFERAGDEYGRLVNSSEFKQWFGDSKVVFRKGERDYFQNPGAIVGLPRLVFHATGEQRDFDVFCPGEQGAIRFCSDPTLAARLAGRDTAIVPAFLKMENPLEVGGEDDSPTIAAAISLAKGRGNDGVILRYGAGEYIYAVFSADRVKSPLLSGPCRPGHIAERYGPQNLTAQACREAPKSFGRQSGGRKKLHCRPFLSTEQTEVKIEALFREIQKRPVQIIGLKIRSYSDLASVARQVRNPDYEELRFFFMRRGVPVDQERIALIHPGYSKRCIEKVFERDRDHLEERVRRLGATAVYTVETDLCGKASRSGVELAASEQVAFIPQYRGHIRIHPGKHVFRENPAANAAEPIKPPMAHQLGGKQLGVIEAIASRARALRFDRGAPFLIYTDSDDTVCGLQEIDARDFCDIVFMRDRMGQKLRDFGAMAARAVLPAKPAESVLDAARYHVSAHVLREAVGFLDGRAYYLGRAER